MNSKKSLLVDHYKFNSIFDERKKNFHIFDKRNFSYPDLIILFLTSLTMLIIVST